MSTVTAEVPVVLTPEVQARFRGETCRYWSCAVPRPRHAVVWLCPAGHRETYWYCAEHAAEMTGYALSLMRRGVAAPCQACPAQAYLVTEPGSC